jgi:hypothetical protein
LYLDRHKGDRWRNKEVSKKKKTADLKSKSVFGIAVAVVVVV